MAGWSFSYFKSMVKSILLYTTIAFILILIFNVVASSVIAGQG
jgi:hypothetical protein